MTDIQQCTKRCGLPPKVILGAADESIPRNMVDSHRSVMEEGPLHTEKYLPRLARACTEPSPQSCLVWVFMDICASSHEHSMCGSREGLFPEKLAIRAINPGQ